MLDFDGKIASSPGNVELKAMVKKTGQLLEIVSDINTPHFDVGRLISRSDLIGALSANVKLNTRINGKQVDHALVKGDIAYIDFKGYRYSNIAADVEGSKDNYKGSVSINDPNGEVRASGNVAFSGKNSKFDVEIFANRVDLHAFNLYHGNPRMVSFTLNAAMEGNNMAILAENMYAQKIANYIAIYNNMLNGADAIIFAGGVGENSARMRKMVIERVKSLGVKIDDELNNVRGQYRKISSDDSTIDVFVLPTNEELLIAQDTLEIACEIGD